MKSFHIAAAALLLATVSSAASAATAEDAAAVQKSLQAYLGSEPGVVTVAPAGDDLQITLDVNPFLAKAKQPDASASVSPIVITAHANGDGTWETKSASPLLVTLNSPALVLDVKMDNFTWTGTFDEQLRGFTKSHGDLANASIKETVLDPANGVKTNIAYTIGKYSSDTTATKRDAGVADITAAVTAENIQGTWSLEGGSPGAGGGSFTLAKVGYQAGGTGVRQGAIMDLIAWLVAHPNKDAIIKDQANLKQLLTAAMPIFESVTGSETFENAVVQTPIGNVTAQAVKIGVDMGGFVKAGRFGENIGLTGIGTPPGIAPPWSMDLIPASVQFGFMASGFDAEAPAKMVIDKFDLSKDPPLAPDISAALAAAVMPNGTINIALPATSITAPAYTITMAGDVNMTPMGPKGGKLDIKMKGLDAVMAKLQEAAQTDPQAAQAISMVVAAKGMAKTEADGTSTWALVMTPEGKVTVNGIDLMGMAPPPAQ